MQALRLSHSSRDKSKSITYVTRVRPSCVAWYIYGRVSPSKNVHGRWHTIKLIVKKGKAMRARCAALVNAGLKSSGKCGKRIRCTMRLSIRATNSSTAPGCSHFKHKKHNSYAYFYLKKPLYKRENLFKDDALQTTLTRARLGWRVDGLGKLLGLCFMQLLLHLFPAPSKALLG